jgi:hypothetical protein
MKTFSFKIDPLTGEEYHITAMTGSPAPAPRASP